MPLSKNNARLVAARKLARDASERAEQGLFLIEGPKLVREALSAGVVLHDVFVSPALASRPDGPAICWAWAAPISKRSSAPR